MLISFPSFYLPDVPSLIADPLDAVYTTQVSVRTCANSPFCGAKSRKALLRSAIDAGEPEFQERYDGGLADLQLHKRVNFVIYLSPVAEQETTSTHPSVLESTEICRETKYNCPSIFLIKRKSPRLLGALLRTSSG